MAVVSEHREESTAQNLPHRFRGSHGRFAVAPSGCAKSDEKSPPPITPRAASIDRSRLSAICRPLLCFMILARIASFDGVWADQAREADAKSAVTSYGYKFESPRFYLHLIEIDMAGDGTGEIRFKRGESDEIIDAKLKLTPAAVARIQELFDHAQFLTSNEDYQYSKDFSHLGWITISARNGDRERKVRFNYTTNADIKELSDIFRAVATQEIHLFDIELMQRHQPLDLPRLLEQLESDLRNEHIAEPERMLASLREITGDDTLPLIARNHATRLIASIEKKKYKSPIKAPVR